jgi:hypothetical protein
MKIKTGTRVNTELGNGVIIGIDLPKSKVKRYIIKLNKNVYNFDKTEYCFHKKELTII